MSIDPYQIGQISPGAHIHLIGVCGTGMSALAKVLLEAGYRVSGCDLRADPPTGPALAAWGVHIHLGYEPAALDDAPDLVVVGNAVTSKNPVALAAIARGLPVTHMPALLHLVLPASRHRLVVAGSHGKSTTTAITAWLLAQAGLDPGWLIGATPLFGDSGRFGSGPFVIEGDEYNAAYFDRGAKFFHYRPDGLGVTTVEFDHADLYADLAAVEQAFARLVGELVPGSLVVLADDAARFATDVTPQCRTVALPETDFELLASGAAGVRFRLEGRELAFPLPGRHAAVDAAIAVLLARHAGAGWSAITEALPAYPGLRLRQEVLFDGTPRVLRDFGHHPTEIKATLAGLRDAWPTHSIVAVFEPRSYTSRTDALREQYAGAFAAADQVLFAPVYNPGALTGPPLDIVALAASMDHAAAYTSFAALEQDLFQMPRPEVVIFFSNGTMDGLPERYAEQLSGSQFPPASSGGRNILK